MYLRQSQDRDGTELGIDRQREQVLALVERNGWTVVEEFVDNDVSATKRKPRPAFEKMLEGVAEGRFDVIAARHMDRLLRRLSELERVLEVCETHEVAVVTAADGVNTATDGGRLVARILSSVAQGEVERKSTRQRDAVLQAARQGRWVGGRRPFGYERDGVTIREDEAAAIRKGYDAVLAGEPVTAVARMWNDAGLSPTQLSRDGSPHPWERSGVRDVLINPRNAGLRRHRNDVAASAERKRAGVVADDVIRSARKNPEAFVVGRAQWPAIVEEDTWRAAVKLLTDPSRRKGPRNAQALLTGVARCHCGASVHAGGARRQYRNYRCRQTPGHLARRAEPIEQYVEDVIVERLSRPDALRLFAPKAVQGHPARDYSADADTLRRRLDDLATDYADGAMTPQQFRIANKRVRDKLAEIESAMSTTTDADLITPLVSGGDVAAAWATLSTPRKRAVIAALCVVTVHTVKRGTRTFRPESVTIEWKSGV